MCHSLFVKQNPLELWRWDGDSVFCSCRLGLRNTRCRLLCFRVGRFITKKNYPFSSLSGASQFNLWAGVR